VQAPSSATSDARPLSLARAPGWVVNMAAAAVIGALTWLIFSRAFLNYDTLYALVWGRDAVHGRSPDYDVTLAPTPHPLAEAVGAVVSPLGQDGAYTAMLLIAMLAFGALVWAVFLLGRECFGWPAGALAAFVVATREPFISQGVRGYVDVPFLALVVAAAVLEARRPRRGTPVLVLLALAGLLRPEAWLLAAVYVVWLWPALDSRGRAGAIALAAVAPVLWAVSDLAVTGDPVFSLTNTRDTAETLGRPRGIVHVPEIMPRRLGEILRWVPLIGGAAGFAWALRVVPRRAAVPAAVAVVSGVAFVLIGIAGLSLLGRYLLLPAAMLAVFFGFAALGWIGWRAAPGRAVWLGGAAVLLVAFVGSTISHQSDRLDRLRDGIQSRGEMQADLRDLTDDARAASLLDTCRPLYVPNHRPVPILAWYLDRDPGEIVSAQLQTPRRGLFVGPATALVRDKFVLDPHDPGNLAVPDRPPGFTRVAGNRSWVLYERGCTGTTARSAGSKMDRAPTSENEPPGVSAESRLRPG
jgi:hypothetical protein